VDLKLFHVEQLEHKKNVPRGTFIIYHLSWRKFMYKKTLLVITLCLYAVVSWASMEMSVGLKSSKPKGFDKSASGIELSLGKKYYFTESFGMKSGVDFSYVGKKFDINFMGQKVAEYKFKEYNLGLVQRFFYDAKFTSVVFSPFLDLGFGYSNVKNEFATIFGESDSLSKKYFYYKYDLGFQLLSHNGVGGELKWGQNKNKDFKSNFGSIAFVYNF